jgi:hypothetical protein
MGKTPALCVAVIADTLPQRGILRGCVTRGSGVVVGAGRGGRLGPTMYQAHGRQHKKSAKKKCFQQGSNQSVVLPTADNFPFGHKRDADIRTNLHI